MSENFTVPSLIEKKRDGKELTEKEIEWFINRLVDKDVQSAQLGAMLMAIFLKGMSDNETSALTKAMMNSGEHLTFPSEIKNLVVDKHSTGGIGDKITLVLIPCLAACGLKVPSIAGRGLGITGGTLDKLESIPGYKFQFTAKQTRELIENVGCFIIGQSDAINPADKIIYVTRDITGTVPSIPLIVSSIMSKKLCEGLHSLVLDVKCGKAAFMNDFSEAEKLAKALKRVGEQLSTNMFAIVTDMNNPIGLMIGNAVEVIEAVETLSGNGHRDTNTLVETFGSYLLVSTGKAKDLSEGADLIKKSIASGAALERFLKMLQAQGVSEETTQNLFNRDYDKVFKKTSSVTEIHAEKSGYIVSIDALILGVIVQRLGGGREKSDDEIDHSVGIVLRKHIGDKVNVGDVWCEIYYNKKTYDFINSVKGAIKIHNEPIPFQRIISVI